MVVGPRAGRLLNGGAPSMSRGLCTAATNATRSVSRLVNTSCTTPRSTSSYPCTHTLWNPTILRSGSPAPQESSSRGQAGRNNSRFMRRSPSRRSRRHARPRRGRPEFHLQGVFHEALLADVMGDHFAPASVSSCLTHVSISASRLASSSGSVIPTLAAAGTPSDRFEIQKPRFAWPPRIALGHWLHLRSEMALPHDAHSQSRRGSVQATRRPVDPSGARARQRGRRLAIQGRQRGLVSNRPTSTSLSGLSASRATLPKR